MHTFRKYLNEFFLIFLCSGDPVVQPLAMNVHVLCHLQNLKLGHAQKIFCFQ